MPSELGRHHGPSGRKQCGFYSMSKHFEAGRLSRSERLTLLVIFADRRHSSETAARQKARRLGRKINTIVAPERLDNGIARAWRQMARHLRNSAASLAS